ncbi:MAG: phosphoribosyl-AMP cyclohydrolase [Caulobacterales bacterium]|uniref:phosphoribosyl-AMP cyclohydrolase n=1 Tax=Glycocaulis sp. TaxID=1969725 RepID=UPI003F9F9A5A
MKLNLHVRAATLALCAGLAVPAMAFADDGLTEAEVLAAQQAWGDALVQIATVNAEQGPEAARETAREIIDAAYGYQLGPVLFKPTLAAAPQTFRTTAEGALAYFVGQDPEFPNDSGFALNDWTAVEIENAAIFIDDETAMTMGNVLITDSEGNVTIVDKTWGFHRDEDGVVRIVLHHSSLPYQPAN